MLYLYELKLGSLKEDESRDGLAVIIFRIQFINIRCENQI